MTPRRVLWRLYLTLFLRGRSARGLEVQSAPKSVWKRLWATLTVYTALGLGALFFSGHAILPLSLYLHSTTFLLLGMFVAVSTGEVLFNEEEADILMHRPVSPRDMLWAKVGVLVQVSLWMAGAFSLIGFFVGAFSSRGTLLFVPVHAVSVALAALFCTGCVVLTYELCLRWFGRERLDGLMTMAQVVVSISVVLGSQLVPQLMIRFGDRLAVVTLPWWAYILPPAWFAGIDDAIAGSGARTSWMLAAAGVAATALVLWLAFAKLAADYETGLRAIGEHPAQTRRARQGRRWLDIAVNAPPLRWWLRDPAARASFLLTAAYLFRDRDTKLRIYPGIAPMLLMPFIVMFSNSPSSGLKPFSISFAGVYLGLIPLSALDLIRYSQHWQAAELFRLVPLSGPGRLTHGTRRAVLVLLTAPMLLVFAVIAVVFGRNVEGLALLLPGIVLLPVYAMLPCWRDKLVPFSQPINAVQSPWRGLMMIAVMIVAGLWSALVAFAWGRGFFLPLLAMEAAASAVLYFVMRLAVSRARWEPA